MKLWIGIFFLITTCCCEALNIQKISLPLTPDLQRADIYLLRLTKTPSGILVLSPGVNGNGEDWIQNPVWQKFAQNNNLDLIGISFASQVPLLKHHRGYYYAGLGSGQVLLDGIRQTYHRDLPLILYGFSGGAHFTSSFVQWKPDRVIAWCAYSAAWWDKPVVNSVSPPGLVACGDDDKRLGASLFHFDEGRALGKPWLWLCAPNTAHSIYPPAENFIRNYFASILKNKESSNKGEWVDIDRKVEAAPYVLKNEPSSTGWLPDQNLLTEWKEAQTP
jgi:hypothetical protein